MSALAGIPISVKDLFGVGGQPTYAGTAERLPPEWELEGFLVRRLREAFGIVLGKTKMVELAFGGLGQNPHWGTPINPWSSEEPRVPGGSSCGASDSKEGVLSNITPSDSDLNRVAISSLARSFREVRGRMLNAVLISYFRSQRWNRVDDADNLDAVNLLDTVKMFSAKRAGTCHNCFHSNLRDQLSFSRIRCPTAVFDAGT
jgi:hypothetical protein